MTEMLRIFNNPQKKREMWEKEEEKRGKRDWGSERESISNYISLMLSSLGLFLLFIKFFF